VLVLRARLLVCLRDCHVVVYNRKEISSSRALVIILADVHKEMVRVPLLTFVLGLALIAITWAFPHTRSLTAFIPAAFGALFLVLGVLALRPLLRKHAMHTAAALALIGFIGAAARAIPAGIRLAHGGDEKTNPNAFTATTIMAVLCLLFVLACIYSFIAAWRRRAKSEASEAAQV